MKNASWFLRKTKLLHNEKIELMTCNTSNFEQIITITEKICINVKTPPYRYTCVMWVISKLEWSVVDLFCIG